MLVVAAHVSQGHNDKRVVTQILDKVGPAAGSGAGIEPVGRQRLFQRRQRQRLRGAIHRADVVNEARSAPYRTARPLHIAGDALPPESDNPVVKMAHRLSAKRGPTTVWTAQADGGAGVRNHQARAELRLHDLAMSPLRHQKFLDGCLVELPADEDDSRAAIFRRPFGERLGGPE